MRTGLANRGDVLCDHCIQCLKVEYILSQSLLFLHNSVQLTYLRIWTKIWADKRSFAFLVNMRKSTGQYILSHCTKVSSQRKGSERINII